jgi:hypothetical protein
MFDAMQVETCEPRRPVINTLYDVFVAIRDDELGKFDYITYSSCIVFGFFGN